jgi:hypothetical protein
MSVNHGNLAPTALHNDSFTLQRAPAVSAAGTQYLRLSAAARAAFETARALHLADGDGGCVATGLLCGCGQVGEGCVGDVVGVQVQRGLVVGVKTLQ